MTEPQLESSDLENDFELTYDEQYDPEREKMLREQLAQAQGSLSPYWARIDCYRACLLLENFNKNAGRFWNDFYKHNGNRFFKDRHYLDLVFDALQSFESNEVGIASLFSRSEQAVLLVRGGMRRRKRFLPSLCKVPNFEALCLRFRQVCCRYHSRFLYYCRVFTRRKAQNSILRAWLCGKPIW